MSRRVPGFAIVAALAAAIAACTAGAAARADECRGLLVCLPAAGPWVVVPARSATQASRVEYELRCPLRDYVVAGTDVRLADPDIDVFLRGETGSPVGPGVTTSRAVLFVATYVGVRRAPTSFKPFIGCVPTTGGGGRALTATGIFRPTRPVTRRVVQRAVSAGQRVAVAARCRGRETVVDASHAVGFRSVAPPTRGAMTSVAVSRQASAARVVADVRVAATGAARQRPVVQVIAHCRKDAP